MSFDASKYLGKQKKKRTCKDFFRYKYLKHKRYCKEQYKKYDAEQKYQDKLKEKLRAENNIPSPEPYDLFKNWCQLLGYVLLLIGFYFLPIIWKHWGETIISCLLLILYGIGWLIGIVLAFVVSKVTFCFLYRQSVNIASNFVVDVLDEVDKKRAKCQDNNF